MGLTKICLIVNQKLPGKKQAIIPRDYNSRPTPLWDVKLDATFMVLFYDIFPLYIICEMSVAFCYLRTLVHWKLSQSLQHVPENIFSELASGFPSIWPKSGERRARGEIPLGYSLDLSQIERRRIGEKITQHACWLPLGERAVCWATKESLPEKYCKTVNRIKIVINYSWTRL